MLKIIKTGVVLGVLVQLAGCFYQSVSYLDIEAANEYCADKGGVYNIREESGGSTYAMCFDEKSHISIDSLAKEIEVRRNRKGE